MDGRRPVRYEPYWEGEAGAPQWGGGYTTTDGQRVTEGDATAMAEALALALQEIPARDETALREARNRVDDAVEKAAATQEAEDILRDTQVDEPVFQTLQDGRVQLTPGTPLQRIAELYFNPPVSHEQYLALFGGPVKQQLTDLVAFIRRERGFRIS